MTLDELTNYTEWLKRTPEEILSEVRSKGGWKMVFPNHLPAWAHKIRNFFNIEPKFLTRFDAPAAKSYMTKINQDLDILQANIKIKWLKEHKWLKHLPEVKMLPNPPADTPYDPNPAKSHIGEDGALSGDVYKETDMIWYQMAPGGTIYHFKDPTSPAREAIQQTALTQLLTPVFKLVSPDRTGGSCETIIFNKLKTPVQFGPVTAMAGRMTVGDANNQTQVDNLLEKDTWFQGSYNYSETVMVGLAQHEKRDVKPHEAYHDKIHYVNPPDSQRHSFAGRKFPDKDNKGIYLAGQIMWTGV